MMTDKDEADRTSGVLWAPSAARMAATNMTAFMQDSDARWKHGAKTYDALHAWSVAEPEQLWQSIVDFQKLKAESWGSRVLIDGSKMPGARFFPDARLNFAENLLTRRDETDALVFWGEDKVKRRLSWDELWRGVSRLAQALRAQGLKEGDRVAGYLPNMPEAVIAMLATASIGAVWSSCSPDFGADGVVDRFGQIEPKVLFAVDGYLYNGKAHDCLAKLKEVQKRLPSLQQTIVVAYVSAEPDLANIEHTILWERFCAPYSDAPIVFTQVPFNAPLYVMFSSGTTGVPKCIVHGVGGTLLKQVSEHALHCDTKPGDRAFYFTTCSWMMWNWLVAALACGATLLLYDGSPAYPKGDILFDFAEAEKATLFGTSAKFIDTLRKDNIRPAETHDLSSVRIITSTGSPLSAEAFDYVYDAVSKDCHLASISGGTDILGCFVLGNPLGAVRRGEIQVPALGMAVDVFDDAGQPVREEKGELVCTRPFPSMPIGFWGDPENRKYRAAYFERYSNIWHHGDFAEITKNGGYVIHGRSDTTLNPGGVRIGTAEIYRQLEKLDFIRDSIVVGQDWKNDVRVVLFVVMKDNRELTPDLIARIGSEIRNNCTPRHVPARIVAVRDVPRTKSGKITESAVRDIIHGRPVKNTHALANPEALEGYRDLAVLKS